MDIRASIEYFHLLFCRLLLTAQDKSLIALKGGCNLRFFHGSNRYSEDIDFDVEVVSRDTLKKRVDKVLASQALQTMLAARKLKIGGLSAPKQTETVQRWKLALTIAGLDAPTKIEFSRRGIDHGGVAFESVSPLALSSYNFTPTFVSHYTAASAI